jgi:predicted nucleotidyltransferase
MMDKAMIPRECATEEVQRWPTLRARDWTDAFLDSARSNANIVAVVAVGSAVRPGVRSGDIDLVVICQGPGDIGEARPLEVDLRVHYVADIDARLESGHDMLGWAVMFGRVLFQRECFWDGVVESWRHRLPLPSPELARARAAAAYRHLTDFYVLGDADAAHEQALSYLTHLARAELLEAGNYPASRPELPEQLRSLGDYPLAGRLDRILQEDSAELSQIGRILELACS